MQDLMMKSYDLQEYEQLQTQQKEIEDKLHEMENSHPRYKLVVFFVVFLL